MKSRFSLFTLLTTLLLAPLAALEAAAAPRQKPNLIIILADDLGYGDVQCYNATRGKIPTPHLDKLAAQGMRFTDGHSSSGVCSPSRYTLLTGRYHWRTRLQSGIVPLWGPPLIAPDRMTIGTLAKQHGYRSAAIGKWHLGWDWPIPEDRATLFKEKPKGEVAATDAHRAVWQEVFSQSIGGGPTTRGFDLYFGTDVPNTPPFCFIENDRTVGIPTEFLPARLVGYNQANIQGPALAGWTLEPILPALGDRAAGFITESAKKPEPFLLYLPLTSPHTPLSVNEAWKGKSGLNLYADFVMETDALVGRVLEALERSGAADNTLVLFTADNGCAPYIGISDLEKMGHYPSGPLRGAKADAWEGGHRVPFIVRWPGKVRAGSVCDQLVQQSDLIATFAEALGVRLPDDAGEDSVSLMPLLKGGDQPVRGNAVSASLGGVPALRSGSWKYIPAPGSGGWGEGGDQSQPVQLYDLANDLGETKNLAAAMPEKVAEMKALLEKLITDGRSTPGAKQRNDVVVTRFPREETPKAKARGKVPKKKPNIILILADDLGYGGLGCYGQTRYQTPHLDRMAAEGARLTQFNCPAPFCAPTRASLLTGRYPFRCGMTANPAPDGGEVAHQLHLSESEALLPELLKKAGYRTGMFGKWHLGHAEPRWLPTHRGFEEYFGIPYSNDMRPVALFEGDQQVEYPVIQANLTKRYTARSLAFIEKHQSHPFFLYLAHAMPHKPLAVSEEFYHKSGGGLYGDAVSELDWSVGQVLAKLKELKLDENTLVMFTSDNGATFGGSTGGLRGMKGSSYEGGYRVPMIARWPGRIPPGQTLHGLAVMMDLFSTTLAAASLAPPGDLILDGHDLLPLLTEGAKSPRQTVFGHAGPRLATVRDGRWKLHVLKPSEGQAGVGKDLKPGERYNDPRGPDGVTILAPFEQPQPSEHPGLRTGDPGKPMQLFDLETDPGEQRDVASLHGDVVRRLKKNFDDLTSQLSEHQAPSSTLPKRQPGK